MCYNIVCSATIFVGGLLLLLALMSSRGSILMSS